MSKQHPFGVIFQSNRVALSLVVGMVAYHKWIRPVIAYLWETST
jgi:hypothetical protein